MSASWPSLHASLLRTSATLSFQMTFSALRRSSPALEPFAAPLELLGFLHGSCPDPHGRNGVLRVLIAAAQTQTEPAKVADVLLLLALWPGLDAVRRRLQRYHVGRSDDLAGEIAARATEAIRKADLARVRWVAATLICNVERDIRRSLAKLAAEAVRHEPLSPELPCWEPPPDPVVAAQQITVKLHEWIGDDAPLVVAIAIEGERQRDAADAHGISYEAARKRYRRALRRLRQIAA